MMTLTFDSPQGMRLDKFILQQYPALGAGRLHQYLRENKIKVNGKKLPLGTQLQKGDEVRLYLPEPSHALTVLYEDAQLLALDKPAGQRCQNEGAAPQTGTLLGGARAYLQRLQPDASGFLPALCHRLDTGTSGVLLVAKTPQMLEFITGLLRERRLEKTYVGLVLGHPQPPQGLLEHWLLKDARAGLVRACRPHSPGAAPAQTRYETLAISGKLALLRLRPHTGRTHQLRVQLAAAGTPLLGDSKYGNQAENRALRCRYQCLCATELRFPPLPEGPFSAYSGLAITCRMPWFYAQALQGTIG